MRDLVIRLARLPLRLPGRNDSGAIGVLVAVLLGGGVLMGLGAMVIDVGQLYQERAELQNGADAASLAVAKSCATGTCTPSLAAQYANANASALTGGTEGVSQVCGSGTLGTCPAGTGAMTDCPSAPSSGLGYVDVFTSTQTAGGATLLPAAFAQALLGNGSYTGTTVKACAQAAWGGPTSANTLAFAISACSWDSYTTRGTNFAPSPPTVPASSYDHQVNLAKLDNNAGCSGEVTGSDGAGAFGWAVDQTGNCGIFTNTTTFPADTGASAGSTCQSALASAYASRKAIFLPVYTTITGTGSNAVFTLKGFAAFVVTGYSLPSFSASDWLKSANNSCSYKCIDGYFTKALIPASGGTSTGGTYLGAAVVGLTG
jgi:Flp pilus assembly protein TadG